MALGFDTVRVTRPDAAPELPARLQEWLAAGHHGDMDWMATNADRRADPRALWADVRSVVMVGMNYGPDTDPRLPLARPDRAAISVYAQGSDYHDLLKGRLKQLGGKLVALARQDGGAELKVFVDTAPVMEKPLAVAAGLGWQGRHTNLVSREFGSWLFLGALFTSIDLPPDAPAADTCGVCHACLDACPTNAFPAPYQLDARRCISYLTIENKGPIPHAFRRAIGNRVYGCDDCLAACPWNKFAQTAREAKLRARDELKSPPLADLLTLDDVTFRVLFAGSPIKRIGVSRFLRNVLIAAGNSADVTLVPAVRRHLEHSNPLVRGAAVWAFAQLAPDEAAAMAANGLRDEADKIVREEWTAIIDLAKSAA